MAWFGGHCGAKKLPRSHCCVLCGDGCVKRKIIFFFECLVLRVFSAIILKIMGKLFRFANGIGAIGTTRKFYRHFVSLSL